TTPPRGPGRQNKKSAPPPPRRGGPADAERALQQSLADRADAGPCADRHGDEPRGAHRAPGRPSPWPRADPQVDGGCDRLVGGGKPRDGSDDVRTEPVDAPQSAGGPLPLERGRGDRTVPPHLPNADP